MLTSLVRTARKQPLLCSEGSSMRKGSVSSGPSALSGELNRDGLSLDETKFTWEQLLKIQLNTRYINCVRKCTRAATNDYIHY